VDRQGCHIVGYFSKVVFACPIAVLEVPLPTPVSLPCPSDVLKLLLSLCQKYMYIDAILYYLLHVFPIYRRKKAQRAIM
jgi:hypothetical protein